MCALSLEPELKFDTRENNRLKL